MAAITTCGQCGAALASEALEGMCPACLVEVVLEGAREEKPDGSAPAAEDRRGVDPSDPAIGARIGRYKIVQRIGEGGCGVVYMAEQEEPVRRRVALKVIKPGMDTRQVVARFEAERQALALMDHPSIAKVFDGGAMENGRPFFVMELVPGIKITDYCDQNSLSTRQRIELFIKVCQAIQHAHQKGVIHRDIKPSNILVTLNDGAPIPKVIDFGIAKATEQRLTDKTIWTGFIQFIGTPAYMSPEQAEMTSPDIDTRSDIYSLGVLLYELLTGQTPFDTDRLVGSGVEEIRRTIREKAPAKPSTRLSMLDESDLKAVADCRAIEPPRLIHLVRGDLDWIVMKCLEKDRTRRYDTPIGLATDLKCHLSNEPVSARPPSRAYQFRKLVRRNKVAFAAAGALIAVLLGGALVSTLAAIRATRAEREQTRLREAAQRAEERESEHRRRAETEAARSAQVAQFMKEMLRSIRPGIASGRDTTLLREILDETATRLDGLTNQPVVEADLRATLGQVYGDLGDYAKAAAMLERSLHLRREVNGSDHLETAQLLNDFGYLHVRRGRPVEAAEAYEKALGIHRKLLGEEHPTTAISMEGLAEALRVSGHRLGRAEPEALIRQALAIRRKVLGREHKDVADSLTSLGFYLCNQERYEEAEPVFREAVAIRRKAFKDPHPGLASAVQGLGDVSLGQRKIGEALECFEEALAMYRKLYGNEHPDVAGALHALAKARRAQGRLAEAEALFREALAMRRKFFGNEDGRIAGNLNFLGFTLLEQNQPGAAEAVFREALAIQTKLNPTHPAAATALDYVGEALEHQNRLKEAESLYRDSLAIRKGLSGNRGYYLLKSLENLTRVLRKAGKDLELKSLWAEAEPLLLSAYQEANQRESTTGEDGTRQLRRTLDYLVQLYEETNRPEQAAEWRQKLAEFELDNSQARVRGSVGR